MVERGGGMAVQAKKSSKRTPKKKAANSQKPTLKVSEKKKGSILELSCGDARKFFLKEKNYCNFDLPPYFQFEPVLSAVNSQLVGKKLSEIYDRKKLRASDGVNHKILNNKDGRYAWRPLQLIHPVLYVALVCCITEKDNWGFILKRFEEFSAIPKIECVSLPVVSSGRESDKAEQVSQWWHDVEQKSIELALDYSHLVHIDLADCYGSIYTHSVAWALHGKDEAKKNKTDQKFVGNAVDGLLQDISNGQTNGIPQGSVLMDFVAEMVLGYADLLLADKIKSEVAEYHIVRYRDDYRIFTHSSQDAEKIVKHLTEVMISLGLRLNTGKTKSTTHIVRSSVKEDKLHWIGQKQSEKSLQKHLLIIHGLAEQFPNSGSLCVALVDFRKRVSALKKIRESVNPLISIVTDIAYNNPKTYAISTAILSVLINFLSDDTQKRVVIDKVKRRFNQIPNTGHLMVWLQRITLTFSKTYPYDEPLCKFINDKASTKIWNSDWLKGSAVKKLVDNARIVDETKIKNLPPVIKGEEVELFKSTGEYYW